MPKETEVVVNPQTPAVLQGKPADIVINQFADLVSKGQLVFPENYNYINSIKYAALVISQTKGLSDCTKPSVVQALSDMALQGLDVQRKQGYFIKYANEPKISINAKSLIMSGSKFIMFIFESFK